MREDRPQDLSHRSRHHLAEGGGSGIAEQFAEASEPLVPAVEVLKEEAIGQSNRWRKRDPEAIAWSGGPIRAVPGKTLAWR